MRTCVVIGESPLILSCIKGLLACNFYTVVISCDPLIISFCEQSKLPYFTSTKIFLEKNERNYNYLFSIVSYAILNKPFLDLFSCAINFHDSLLPRYAGSNATTWALLNNESEHGITWHRMNESIDTGDILLQRKFPITSNDTAFSLTQKCYHCGMESFSDLLQQLVEEKYSFHEQDLNQRSYYSKYHYSPGILIIDFTKESVQIDRIYRAFNLRGSRYSPLPIPKILINNEAYNIMEMDYDDDLYFPAGSIIQLNNNQLSVATTNGVINIKRLTTAHGKEMSILDIAGKHNLVDSNILHEQNENRIKEIYVSLKMMEEYWNTKISDFYSVRSLSFVNSISLKKNTYKSGKLRHHITAQQYMESICSFFRGINNNKTINFFYSDEVLLKKSYDNLHLSSQFIPVIISSDDDLQQLTKNLSERDLSCLFSSDLFLRNSYIDLSSTVIILTINAKNIPLEIPFSSYVLINFNLSSLYIDIEERNAALTFQCSLLVKYIETFVAYTLPSLSESNENLISLLSSPKINKFNEYLFEEDRPPITIAELDRRSNQLAHYLLTLDIAQGSLVAVSLKRSFEFLVSILSVLKAGAAYVPIDSDYPINLIRYILKDTCAKWLLTTSDNQIKLNGLGAECILLDALDLSAQPLNPVDIPLRSSNLAYVIYTSGSTGTPYGVSVSHGNLVSAVNASNILLNFPSKNFLAITSIGFDNAILDYLLPWINHGKVFIENNESQTNGIRLRGLLEQNEISAMQATPTTWQMLLNSGWRGHPDFIIITCGEALAPSLAQPLLECGQVYNIYGMTEATIYATGGKVTNPFKITIGKPLNNSEIYLLDDNQHLVLKGEIGEIYIGGQGVAYGYLNQPLLTAKHFLSQPSISSSRLYRTGDLARYCDNDEIEYIGRIDKQIKIRGYRVELGEIEAVLRNVPNVNNAIVMVNEVSSDLKQLIAYIETNQSHSDTSKIISLLSKICEDSLPSYMQPHRYLIMHKFPVMNNGKTDREKLKMLQPNGVRV